MHLIILAESSLELIPKSIASEHDIVKYAKKRKKKPEEIILDSNYHWKAIKKLPDAERRGRPDIVYRSLLTIFDSLLYKCGLVDVIVHTINDDVLYFKKNTRLPRHYARFIGLMEQVLYYKKAPVSGEPLIYVKRQTLSELVNHYILHNFYPIEMTSKGTLVSPSKFYELSSKYTNLFFIIGGFSHGHISSDLSKFKISKLSIFKEPITTQSVCNYVLHNTPLFAKDLEKMCF